MTCVLADKGFGQGGRMKKRKAVRKILQESSQNIMVTWTKNCGVWDVNE